MKIFRKRDYLFILILILLLSLAVGCNQQVQTDNLQEENIVEEANKASEESNNEETSEENVFTNIDENLIDSKFAMDVITELSSEKYKGRLPGTEGNNLAVDYIVNQFKVIGLENPQGLEDYKQYYSQKTIIPKSAPSLSIVDDNGNKVKEFEFIKDYKPRTFWANTKIKGETTSPIYVIDNENKFKNKDELKGKTLLIDKKVVKKYNPFGIMQTIMTLDTQIDAVILNYDNRKDGVYPISRNISHGEGYNNDDGSIILYCTDDVFNEIKAGAEIGHRVEVSVDYAYEEVEVPNVVGIIPGSDESLKDEFIIIGAHLDHVGDNMNGTYNPGAYDNASGISGLLETAKVLNNNKIKPKKSIVFIAFNGEEEYLLGSKYYVENPIYPLDKSILINLDCIGVKTDVPLELDYNSTVSIDLVDKFYKLAQELEMDCKKVKEGGGDHKSFDEKGVQSVLLIDWDSFTLHTINDTVENAISEERLEKTIKLILYYLDKNVY